jgi:hypothetical protein
MDRRRVARWAAALALGGAVASTARAGAVTFTGNVSADMPTLGQGVGYVAGLQPSSVAQDSWISQSGWVNGWVIKDLRFDYNQSTDTMQVGVNFYSIAGNPSGNPAGSDPRVAQEGGYAPANLGGRDSITVEFAAPNTKNPNQVGTPTIVAGVPEYKSSAYTGTDGFTVATPGTSPALQDNYGSQINSAMGNLVYSPSPAHPDFEFTIKKWSQFAALNGSNGFYISAYADSPDDVVAGESNIGWTHVLIPYQQVLPEPTALAAWSLMIGGAAWALRRSRRIASEV